MSPRTLERAELERRAAAIGFRLIDEPNDCGVSVEAIHDPEGDGLLGGSLPEVAAFLTEREYTPETWSAGASIALDLLRKAAKVDEIASLEAQYRDIGAAQHNFVVPFLYRVMESDDRRIVAAFAAVLSEYISSCEHCGTPYLEFMQRIAAAPPQLGTRGHEEPQQGTA